MMKHHRPPPQQSFTPVKAGIPLVSSLHTSYSLPKREMLRLTGVVPTFSTAEPYGPKRDCRTTQ